MIYAPADEHKEHHVHHPAHLMYVLTLVLVALVVIFGFISVFVPWAMKDIGVGQRAWAFPFKTCVENTFSDVNEETCLDNDFIEPQGVPLTGASEECKAYILGVIAMVFVSVLLGVITLIILIIMIEHLWWTGLILALILQVLLIIICIACFLAWGLFIVYAELTCAEGSIFPVHGYSYGFILYCFNTAFSIGSVVTGFLGMHGIKRYRDMEEARQELVKEMPHFALYPREPETPAMQPAWVESPSYATPPLPYYMPPYAAPYYPSAN